ncbi:MAG: helix-turn-helix domain-containing protein, partial [Bdellovibrionales bacterium]|nr:helix-turn-helix domain-containing protein [Bdellovibrionales bacterium]
EFKLLKLISSRPGQVFSRDRLIDHVWGISKNITERTIDAHISHLRKKLADSAVRIETVLSAGYKIEA